MLLHFFSAHNSVLSSTHPVFAFAHTINLLFNMMLSTVCNIFVSVLLVMPTVLVQAKIGLRGRFRHHVNITKHDANTTDTDTDTQYQQQVHVLMLGLPEGIHLTPAQAHFFDESLREAYNSFNTHPDLQVDHVEVVLQEESDPNQEGGNRDLVTWDPRYGKFYDYSVFMTWRCGRMCPKRRDLVGAGTDNNNHSKHQQHRRREQQEGVPKPVLPDIDHSKFEPTFLSMLQRGPHPLFQSVKDCRITWEV